MEQKYWILTGGWILFYFLHSVLASTEIKSWFEGRGVSKTAYRKMYVVFSTLALFAILIYSSTFAEDDLINAGGFTRYLSLMLAAVGSIVIRVAFKQYNAREFLGLREENPSHKLAVNGILAYVRHPLYTGTILILLGYLLFVPKLSSVITVGIAFIYLIIGIHLEEKKLILELGDTYREYKEKVPALFPRIRDLLPA